MKPFRLSGRPRCAVTGKEMWDEPGQATAAMAHKGIQGTIRAYRCPFCEQYHQTGSGNRKKRGKR